MKIKQSIIFGIAGAIVLAAPAGAFAATINLTPDSGSYPANRPFKVDLVIDEKTEAFNAAQAEVLLSSNLTATDLVLGNCEFSFVKTPTVQNPSFVGVTLGGSKQNCVLYTLTLYRTGNDEGSVTISNGSVKRYGDAKELITAVSKGKYTAGEASVGSFIASVLSGGNANPTQLVPVSNAATTITAEKDLSAYTVAVKVTDESDQPLKNTEVVLSPQQETTDASTAVDTSTITVTTDDKGVATFTNVKPNVYEVKAKNQEKLIAEAIINAKGSAEVLTLGVQTQRQPENPIVPVVGLILMILAVTYFIKTRIWNLLPAKAKSQDNTPESKG